MGGGLKYKKRIKTQLLRTTALKKVHIRKYNSFLRFRSQNDPPDQLRVNHFTLGRITRLHVSFVENSISRLPYCMCSFWNVLAIVSQWYVIFAIWFGFRAMKYAKLTPSSPCSTTVPTSGPVNRCALAVEERV